MAIKIKSKIEQNTETIEYTTTPDLTAEDLTYTQVEELNQLIEMSDQIQKLKKTLFKSYDKLKASLLEDYMTDAAEDQSLTVETPNGSVTFTERGHVRTITDLELVRAYLGDEAFFKIATVKLSDIDKYLTESQRQKVLEQTQTGYRKVVATKK